MAVTAQRGPGTNLPRLPIYNPSFVSRYSGQVTNVNELALAASETFAIPAGQWLVTPGRVTFIQFFDPQTQTWRSISQTPNTPNWISSDGVNVRLANLTGCALGAFITNVGSNYTSEPLVSPNAGNSVWRAIVGGAINTSVTIAAGGLGYAHAPMLIVEPPPEGGVQATAVATVSAGAINGVLVLNQGAGYKSNPRITIVPDPRDSIVTEAELTTALTGSGVVTAILCTDHGTPVTSVPTLTISGGGGASAAATAVMCFAATGFNVDAGGTAYGNAQPFGINTIDGRVAGTPGGVVNPALSTELLQPRQAVFRGTSTAGGLIATAGSRITDSGLFSAVPVGVVSPAGNGTPTAVGQVTITVGGVPDLTLIQAI